MEEINSSIDAVSKLGSALFGLSGFTLTVLFCLLLGVVLKWTDWVDNRFIPVVIIFSGMLLEVLLADTMTPPMYFRLWLMKNAVVGGLAGGVAWGIHSNRYRIPGVRSFAARFSSSGGGSNPVAFIKPKLKTKPKKDK